MQKRVQLIGEIKTTGRFVFVTFGISWLIWLPAILFVSEEYKLFFLLPGSFGPFIAAIVFVRKYEGKERFRNWFKDLFRFRIPLFWYIFPAILLPLAMALLHHGLYLLLGGSSGFTLDQPWHLYFLNLIATSLIGGGNEEPGWRGYLTPKLLVRFSPIITCIGVGIIWTLWHLPLYFLESWSGNDQPVYLFVLYAVPLSLILTWLYYQSGGSIIPVILLHSSTNIVFEYFTMQKVIMISPGFDFNVLKVIVYWLIALVLIMRKKGKIGANVFHQINKTDEA